MREKAEKSFLTDDDDSFPIMSLLALPLLLPLLLLAYAPGLSNAICLAADSSTFLSSNLTSVVFTIPNVPTSFFSTYVDLSISQIEQGFSVNVSGRYDNNYYPYIYTVFSEQDTVLAVIFNVTLPVKGAASVTSAPSTFCNLMAILGTTSLVTSSRTTSSSAAFFPAMILSSLFASTAYAAEPYCNIPIFISISIGLPQFYDARRVANPAHNSSITYELYFSSPSPTLSPTPPTPKPTYSPSQAPTQPLCRVDADCATVTGNNSWCERIPGNFSCLPQTNCTVDNDCDKSVYGWCPLALKYCVGRLSPRDCTNSISSCLGAANGYCNNAVLNQNTFCSQAASCSQDSDCHAGDYAWCPETTNMCTARSNQPECQSDADCGGAAAGWCYNDPNFPQCFRKQSCSGNTDCNGGYYAQCINKWCTAVSSG